MGPGAGDVALINHDGKTDRAHRIALVESFESATLIVLEERTIGCLKPKSVAGAGGRMIRAPKHTRMAFRLRLGIGQRGRLSFVRDRMF